jgi:hypothetical protein
MEIPAVMVRVLTGVMGQGLSTYTVLPSGVITSPMPPPAIDVGVSALFARRLTGVTPEAVVT